MKMVLSSDNAHKLREFREILSDSGIELVSKKECGCTLEVEENGSSFAENAYLKAAAVSRDTGLPAIADDSGLCVDALDGAPGLYSARFTGSHEDSDEARNRYLLQCLAGEENRRGHYVCAICCVMPDGAVLRSEATCSGYIGYEEQGEGGFGYDPLFRPDGYERTMAELTAEEKNAISHRGAALRAFKAEWEKYYDQQ